MSAKKTCAETQKAPILEIGAVLAARGHTIEFATLEGRQQLVKPYPFVSAVHVIGRAITESQDEEFYLRLQKWDNKSSKGKREVVKIKQFSDSFWAATYRNLKRVIQETKPDLIFADYQVEAAVDLTHEYCIPLVTMWPQMPWLLSPQKWIPGEPGTQTRCLTSEHASIYDRLYDQTYLLRWSPYLIRILLSNRKRRREAGVKTMLQRQEKPDYLLLVNSFFGLEPAKDLPPLMHPVGPILADTYPRLTGEEGRFLTGKQAIVYVAFGTHMFPTAEGLEKILLGLNAAIVAGHLDGVIWSFKAVARKQLDFKKYWTLASLQNMTWEDMLSNKHPSWLFVEFASQRAILNHSSAVLFLTHAGPSSANEGLYHGVPMLAMPIGGDQIQEAMRLVAAGVAMSLNKDAFSTEALSRAVETILTDRNGEFRRNVLRMQRIAHVAARRKHLAADLIEEFLYDWGLRFELDPGDLPVRDLSGSNGGREKELSPMHLQTADARMSWLKANNIDLWLIFFALCAVIVAIIVIAVEVSIHRHK